MEMLVVIGVIAILASMTVGVVSLAKTSSQEKRIEGQLNKLVTAIEQYKSKVGYYPPDHQLTGANGQPRFDSRGRPLVNPVMNPLYYELSGVVVDINAKTFTAVGDPIEHSLSPGQVTSWFGANGFQNSGRDLASVPSVFNGFKDSDYRLVDGSTINGSPAGSAKLLTVPVDWARQFENSNPLGKTTLNVWKYNSSNPTNNPTTFDLWAEIPTINESGQFELKVIGNWKVN